MMNADIDATNEKESLSQNDSTQALHEHTASSLHTARSYDSIDLEKAALDADSHKSPQLNSISTPPLAAQRSPRVHHEPAVVSPQIYARQAYFQDDYPAPSDKALKLLSFMVLLLPATCLVISLWSIAAIIYAVLSHPYNLLRNKRPLSTTIADLLSPTYRFQARSVYAYKSSTSRPTITILLRVSLLSLPVAVACSLAGGAVALFWCCSAIVGNPASSNSLDTRDDGREMVIGLRRWWLNWLTLHE